MSAAGIREDMTLFERIRAASCARTRNSLSDLLDGELHGRHERRVRRHLLRCDRCRAVRDSLARVVGQLRRLGEEEPGSGSVADSVLARISSEGPQAAHP